MVCWPCYIRGSLMETIESSKSGARNVTYCSSQEDVIDPTEENSGAERCAGKMLNREHECAEVLQQLAAIRGAVNGMMMQVIQGHLTDHVVKEPEEGQREADLEVVMQVIKSYLK